ncbi:MAG: hypothetical protein JSR77_13035 [Planctomycetes bacterium]|nr:hypothetical protein [Planctomycetota bacterium]
MPLQRTLLRAMLWTLAAAAGVGVLMIFIPGREITGRLFATGIITAVSIAVAMPIAKLLDTELLRVAGLAGLGVIVSTFVTALLAVWIGLLKSSLEEKLGLTAFAMGVCGIAGSGMIALRCIPGGKLSGYTGLGCALAAFLLLFAAIWSNALGLSSWNDELAESAGHLVPLGLLAIACLFGIGDGRPAWRILCGLGVLAAVVAFQMGMVGVWIKPGGDPTWFAQCIILAATIAHANLVHRIPLPAGQRWLTLGAIGAMIATAAAVTAINITTRGFDTPPGDLLSRIAAACGIVTGCATLSLIVLHRFNKRAAPMASAALSSFTSLHLTCPRCHEKQNAPLGTSGCTGCGLLLTVRISEPRCPACNYAVLDLKSDTCPECGGKLFPRGVAIPALDPTDPLSAPNA